GDFERVRAALAAFSARLAVRLEPAQAYAATVTLLSGSESGPVAPVVLPDGLRRSVREALRAELARYPGDPLLSAWLRTSASFPKRWAHWQIRLGFRAAGSGTPRLPARAAIPGAAHSADAAAGVERRA